MSLEMNNKNCIGLITTPANENRVYKLYGDKGGDSKHFIMWSGGADSTLLLYELLDAYGSDRVVAVSYTYPWLTCAKKSSEKGHRDAFKAKMKLKGDKYSNFKHITFDVNAEYEDPSQKFKSAPSVQQGGLPQAIAWLLTIPLYVPDNSYIYTGAIRTDDLTYWRKEYSDIVTNISEILCRDFVYREPYIQLEKHDVLEKLFLYGIYDTAWCCEMPTQIYKPCLQCAPCKTHLLALHFLMLRSSSEEVRVLAKSAYEKLIKKDEDSDNKEVSKSVELEDQ